MARRLILLAIAASAIGVAAPSASARCAPDTDPVVCTVNCTLARLVGAWCKS